MINYKVSNNYNIKVRFKQITDTRQMKGKIKSIRSYAARTVKLDAQAEAQLHSMAIKKQLQPREEKLETHKSIKIFKHGLREYVA